MPRPRLLAALLASALALCSCDRGAAPPQAKLRILVAASLAPALDDALARWRPAHPGTAVEVDAGGSVVLARRVVDLGARCDLLLLADAEVMDEVVIPAGAARGWVAFAGGSVAVACVSTTALARDLAALPPEGRLDRLARPGVRIARTATGGAPIGWRALLVFALEERRLGERGAGIEARLRANAPEDLVRPSLALTEALVEAGEADACLDYPSSAGARGLASFALPPEVDLSDPSRAATYARASVEVPGARPGETRRVAGAPVRYAAAIPTASEEVERARSLLALLCSEEGRALLERRGHRAIAPPERHGEAPALEAR